MPDCKHNTAHEVLCNLAFIDDIGRYMAEIRINCVTCGKPFKFLGLPLGLDYNSAAVSPDGLEVRLGIAPAGDAVPPIHGVEGFSIRRAKP